MLFRCLLRYYVFVISFILVHVRCENEIVDGQRTVDYDYIIVGAGVSPPQASDCNTKRGQDNDQLLL